MSNVKISNLTETATLADSDELAVVDVSDTAQAASGSTRKTLLSTLRSFLGLDEDDMASDSATHFPTQQSVKAYVDAGTSQLLPLDGSEDMTGDLKLGGAEIEIARSGNGRYLLLTKGNSPGGDTMIEVVHGGTTHRRAAIFDANGTELLRFYENLGYSEAVAPFHVPAPTADDHAATKEYVDDETSQLAPLASPTFTGDVVVPDADADGEAIAHSQNLWELGYGTIKSTIPRLGFFETDATADARVWTVTMISGDLYVQAANDANGALGTPMVFRRDDEVDMALASAVTVPAPTADSHAATKEYVDDETSQLLPLDGSSDMTGTLRLTAGGGAAELESVSPYIDFVESDQAVDETRSRIVAASSHLQFSLRADDGSGLFTPITLRRDGEARLTGATSVTVPAPTADSHAATKKYVDDETAPLLTARKVTFPAFGAHINSGATVTTRTFGRWPGLDCPAGVESEILQFVSLPDWGVNVDIWAIWSSQGTDTGDAEFQIVGYNRPDGVAQAGGSSYSETVNVAAPGVVDQIVYTKVADDVLAQTDAGTSIFRRWGDQVGDTLTDDITLFALVIVPTGYDPTA